MDPAEFREGDIVEATGVFIAYPTAEKDHHKCVFTLRSLTLLDSSVREVSCEQLEPWQAWFSSCGHAEVPGGEC